MLRNDDNARTRVPSDELAEMRWHCLVVVCDQHPPRFRSHCKNVRISNARQACFGRRPKIDTWLQALNRPQDEVIQVRVRLEA